MSHISSQNVEKKYTEGKACQKQNSILIRSIKKISRNEQKLKVFTELNLINIHQKFPVTNPSKYWKSEYSTQK